MRKNLVFMICSSLALAYVHSFSLHHTLTARIKSATASSSRAGVARCKYFMMSDVDWRSFRAKLVSQETKGGSENPAISGNDSPVGGEEWVYDAGKFVETGSVILGGSQMEHGFGLRQQYFHKSVMLVLSQDDRFTKGIILNRPTSKHLSMEYVDEWRLW